MKKYNNMRIQTPDVELYNVGITPQTRSLWERAGEVRIYRIPFCDSMTFKQIKADHESQQRRMLLFELPSEQRQIFNLLEFIGQHTHTTESELKEFIETEHMKAEECEPLLTHVLGSDLTGIVLEYIKIQADFETLSTQLEEMSRSGILHTTYYDIPRLNYAPAYKVFS